MADQTSQQASTSAVAQPLGVSIPQLQRTIYDKSDGTFRTGNPAFADNGVDMEQYYQPLERFHGSGLHGSGIAAGLQVAVTANQKGITVQPGIALDSNGLHMMLVQNGQVDLSPSAAGPLPNPPVSPGTQLPITVSSTGVTVPTITSAPGDQYLVIHFGEHPSSDTPTIAFHTPWLHFIRAADLPLDGSCVALARVTCDATGLILALAQDVRQRADHHVERAQPVHEHGPGVLAGLDVEVTLTSSGVTVLPGLALDGNGQYIALNSGGQAWLGSTSDNLGAAAHLSNVNVNGVTLPTTGLIGDQYLTIQYWETPQQVTLPLPPTRAQVAPYRFVSTPQLQLVPVTGFVSAGTSIILATVSFGTGTNAGVVTNLVPGLRQTTNLSVGSIRLLKSTTPSPAGNNQIVSTVDAGSILSTANGLAITVSNPSDEVDMEREDGGNFAKVSLAAEHIVARNAAMNETVIIDSEAGSITTTGAIAANSLSSAGAITANSLTTTGLISAGSMSSSSSVSASTLSASGAVSANSLTTTGAVSAGSLTTTGTITGNSLTTTGTISAGSLSSTGPITANSLTTSGAASAGSLTTTGPVSAGSLATTGTITGNSLTATGSIKASSLAATGTVSASTLSASSSVSTGSLFASGSVSAGSFSASNSVATNTLNANTLAVGLSSPRTPLHVLGRIATGLDFTSAGAITFFPPDGFAWFHIDNGPNGRTQGRLRFSFGANPGDNEVMSIDQAKNVTITGNFSVTGQKKFIHEHPTDATKQVAYISLEGGESGTYIRGKGTLVDGKATIELPEHFRLVTNPQDLTIQLTPRGEWLQLYAVELDTAHIVVREAQGKNGDFDYFVQGIRAGYENYQPVEDKM